MLYNAICAFNFSSVGYILIGFGLVWMLASNNPAIALKKTLLKINFLISCCIFLVKLGLGLTAVADSIKTKTRAEATWLRAFGFTYDALNELRLYKTVEAEVASFCITAVYFFFMLLLQKILHKASHGTGGIERDIVRINPAPR